MKIKSYVYFGISKSINPSFEKDVVYSGDYSRIQETNVSYPEVEPTNSLAERGLRKFVVIKKIVGCFFEANRER